MKKLLAAMLILCVAFTLITGCEQNNDNPTPPDSGVDVDLTVLSTTMMEAQIQNIFDNSADFIGKTIKIQGNYLPWDYEGRIIHYIMVECSSGCPKGFEIMHSDDSYKYPAEDTEIKLTGVFGLYDEDGYTDLPYLEVDDITVID